MEERQPDELESAVESIEDFQRHARDKTEKKEPSPDPESLLSEIVGMFDSLASGPESSEETSSLLPDKQKKVREESEAKTGEVVVEIPAVRTERKKPKERRSKKKSRKEKFAYIAEQSAKAREEIAAARAREELRSKVSEMIGMLAGTIEEISQIKAEKTKEVQDIRQKTDTSAQSRSVGESEKPDIETPFETEAQEIALNEPEEAEKEACESEENTEGTASDESSTAEEKPKETEQSVPEKREEIPDQEPEFMLPNSEEISDMPDTEFGRTSYAPDQKWQIFYMLGALLLIVSVYFALTLNKGGDIEDSNTTFNEPTTEEKGPERPQMDPKLKDRWLSNKAINPDYVGELIFDSGLIEVSFVQAKDIYDRNGNLYSFYTENGNLVEDPEGYDGNDVYIWTNWKTGRYDNGDDEGGSVFMDFRNSLNDQNIIIYGHHFARDWDPQGSKQFTPLDLLLEEENYEANKTLKLVLNDEIREYAVTNVFVIDVYDDYELNFMRRNMNEDFSGNPDPEFFRDYIEYINRISRYETSEKLSEDDRILTLVTCMQHQPELRQIIVCRETGRTAF